jgi:hypothetical protein
MLSIMIYIFCLFKLAQGHCHHCGTPWPDIRRFILNFFFLTKFLWLLGNLFCSAEQLQSHGSSSPTAQHPGHIQFKIHIYLETGTCDSTGNTALSQTLIPALVMPGCAHAPQHGSKPIT